MEMVQWHLENRRSIRRGDFRIDRVDAEGMRTT